MRTHFGAQKISLVGTRRYSEHMTVKLARTLRRLIAPGSSRISAVLLAAVMLATVLSAPGTAMAQGGASWSVEHFEPAPDQGNNILSTVSSRLLPHLMPSFGLFVHYAKDPLVYRRANDSDSVGSKVIEHQVFGEMWASLGLFDWVNISIMMPLVLHSEGAGLEAAGVSGFAAGDMRIIPKVKIVDWQESGGFGLALAADIYVPTGNTDAYRGDGVARIQPRLILDGHNGFFQVSANFAYQTRPRRNPVGPNGVPSGMVYDDVFRWSLGVAIPTVDEMQILLNAYGNFQIDSDKNPYTNENSETRLASPIDALAALQFRLPYELVLTAGGGLGFNRAAGSPEYRAFFSFSYTPSAMDRDGDGIRDAVDKCPERPEDFDEFQDDDGCPENDNDGDGIQDDDDQCPTIPEDMDDFEDEDGCPEGDNDGDGIQDAQDNCPTLPEDMDNFEDSDGCPEDDNDKDGIPDVTDKCPLVPEDKDGFQDLDGCPDLDNDGDGIPDTTDKCPLEKETVNGFKDDDGCPDKKPAKAAKPIGRVKVTGLKIEITDKVYFRTGKAEIKSISYSLLKEVATVIRRNPQVTKVRIEGHTDNRGGAGYNRRLSNMRAKAVRRFLINEGVSSLRLEAQGYGEDRPRESNSTRQGRKNNRRVEFSILSINGKPVKENAK